MNDYSPNPAAGVTIRTVDEEGELVVYINQPTSSVLRYTRSALERLSERSPTEALALRMVRLIEEAQAINQPNEKASPKAGQ